MKLPFKTSPAELDKLSSFKQQMIDCGLDDEFVRQVFVIASFDQGTFDLIELWSKSVTIDEQNEIVNDLKQSIRDWS